MSADPENHAEAVNEVADEKAHNEQPKQDIKPNIEETNETDTFMAETENFKNKTDRLKHNRVKCESCSAEMSLKTLRYITNVRDHWGIKQSSQNQK